MTAPAAEALPRVSGRHKNHVLAAQRRTAAVRLLREGQTYQQVADTLGYANKGTVHRLVRKALVAHEVDEVDSYRHTELERLDALQAALWDQALAGDVRASEQCLRIVQTRVRLLALDQQARAGDPRAENCNGVNTLVVAEDDCRWDGCAVHGTFATASGRDPKP